MAEHLHIFHSPDMSDPRLDRKCLKCGVINWEGRYAYKITDRQDHWIKFRAVKIISEEANGAPCLVFERFDENGAQEFPIEFDEAETVLSGSIKWDGCSDWDFHTNDCMRHFCGRSDASALGRLIDHFYDIAATLPTWDADLAQ